MSEEKKNGSAASPAAGTVSHNLSVSNTTISSQLYQGEIYGELEQMAVDEVIGRLQAGGKLYTATLRKIATEVQRVMRSQVAILSLPVSKRRAWFEMDCTEDDFSGTVCNGVDDN